ncbi:hypothetical protein [Aeromicrobium sp. Sec7.5]|uniref:hypothetical protein n=1 Tax=Aeromicrobium sp. Sec7.5 TaxID=3121276 RepID=UPI002FE4D294
MNLTSLIFSIAGVVVSAFGVCIALLIACRQNKQSTTQAQVLQEVSDLTLENARVLAELHEQTIEADSTNDESPDADLDADRPVKEEALVAELRARGAKLDWAKLIWRKKTTRPPRRGNLGWFVYSESSGERWFVHSGRAISARRAVPMERIEAWEEKVPGATPEDIRIDYQTGAGRGSHAWYIETYDGRTWKLSKGGAGVSGVTVTEVSAA